MDNGTANQQATGGHRQRLQIILDASNIRSPQGSVIGPVLFLLYINDITSDIKSTMRLFADDSVIYRDINSEEDNISLQHDLQALSTWSQKWLMSFNVKKCAVITITRKRKPYLYNYTLCNESIPRVNSYKYLGVTVTKDLRWKEHCQLKTNAANRLLACCAELLHHAQRR